MTDVDCRRKGTAEGGRQQRAYPVGQQRGACFIAITGRFRTLQILQGTDDIQQPHRQYYRQILPAQRRIDQCDHLADRPLGPVPLRRDRMMRQRARQPAGRTSHQSQHHPQNDSDQPSGQPQRQAQAPGVDREQQHHGQQGYQWRGENLESETHRNEGQGNASQRRQQGGTGGIAPEPVGNESSQQLHHGIEKTGKQPDSPGQLAVAGLPIDRGHHQKQEGHQADRVDPVGQCGDIVTTRP